MNSVLFFNDNINYISNVRVHTVQCGKTVLPTYLDTVFRIWNNESLFCSQVMLFVTCMAMKQQIPFLKCLVKLIRYSNPRTRKIITTVAFVWCKYDFVLFIEAYRHRTSYLINILLLGRYDWNYIINQQIHM